MSAKLNSISEAKFIRTVAVLMRLVRWPNLLIIILTQALLQFSVIIPLADVSESAYHFSFQNYILLSLATVLIAASGYIINDYFDVEIDRINKPEQIIIGKNINRKQSLWIYRILNIAGITAGILLAYRVEALNLGLIFPLAAGLLWMYSAQYKRRFLVGNLVVAALSALPVLLVWLFDYFAVKSRSINSLPLTSIIHFTVWFYTGFAFLLTLVREMIKDIQDMHGDNTAGCQTLPLVLGVRNTKKIIQVSTALTMVLLAFGQYLSLRKELEIIFWYYLITVQVLLGYLWVNIRKSSTSADYRFAGNLAKIIMLAGILGMQLFMLELRN